MLSSGHDVAVAVTQLCLPAQGQANNIISIPAGNTNWTPWIAKETGVMKVGEGHDRQILGNEGVVAMGMIKIHHTHAWYFQGIMKRHPKKGSTFFFSLVSEVDFKVFQHGSLSPSLGLPSPLFLSQVFFFKSL